MSGPALLRRLRSFLRHRRVDDEIQRELAFHVAMEAEERRRRGAATDEARRTALRDFGGLDQVREGVRDARGLTWAHALLQDARFGLRLLRRRPGFTVTAALILAVGIGANTAMFSIVDVLLFKPRPGHLPGQLVAVYSRNTKRPDVYRAFSYATYTDLRGRPDLFASLSAHNFALVGWSEGSQTRRVLVDVVTSDFFDTFGTTLPLGRAFTAAEEQPGANQPVVVLSYPAWQRMGGEADVLGRTIRLNGRAFTIVGAVPKGFGGSTVFMTPELWAPTGVYDSLVNDFIREDQQGTLADRTHFNLILAGRLTPGATVDSIRPALDGVSGQIAAAYPEERNQALQVAPLPRMGVSTSPVNNSQIAVLGSALLTMSGVVLLVASFNLANMLLARNSARRKEFAIRLAIGGSRGRIVRQLLTESVVLSLIGGAGGVGLAVWATDLLVTTLAGFLPISLAVDAAPNARVLAAALVSSLAGAAAFGLLPALKLARTDAAPELKDQAGELPATRRRRFGLTHALVMGQLGLSFVLLVVAGLFVRSAVRAAGSDPGFTLDRGILVELDPSLAGYSKARVADLYETMLARLRARPEVASASLASLMPFSEFLDGKYVQRAGAPIEPGSPEAASGLIDSTYTSIGTQYFETMGLPLVAGRDFTPAEASTGAGPLVAIVDEPLARRLFGRGNPIGQDVQYKAPDAAGAPVVLRVVGLVPGLRDELFNDAPNPHLYVPFGQAFQNHAYLHLRTRAASADAEAAILPSIRADLQRIDPALPILALQTRPIFRDHSLMLAVVRAGAAIFLVFGGVAMLLASLGIYGVKAYLVSRRTREIGIRMALGATPRDVVWMVVRDGLVSSAIGLAIGAGLAALAGITLRSFTYQGQGADLGILAAAFGTLLTAVLIAAWLPARRATRIGLLHAIKDN